MKLYIDDDSIGKQLLRLLHSAGHDAQIPKDVGLVGALDPNHLKHAIRTGRVFMSANHDDFMILHELICESGGSHPGIVVVRYDNDKRRDMTPNAIIRALNRLKESELPLDSQFVILNQWR